MPRSFVNCAMVWTKRSISSFFNCQRRNNWDHCALVSCGGVEFLKLKQNLFQMHKEFSLLKFYTAYTGGEDSSCSEPAAVAAGFDPHLSHDGVLHAIWPPRHRLRRGGGQDTRQHHAPTGDDGTLYQCCGSGMFIPDPGSWFLPIPDPGSRISDLGSPIPDPGSRISDPGSRISDLGSPIPDPGSRIPDPGSKNPI